MGVLLQLILGTLLVLATCSFAEQRNLRQIREAPPPGPAPVQNVTEINNRDLNKIVKNNPKTETLDPKSKPVNNDVNNFPLKLGNSDEEHHNDTTSKEVETPGRKENSRAIDTDASKFWSSDFHSKNNVFPADTIIDTTQTTKLFDQKFKETVESVEQTLDDIAPDNEEHYSREQEDHDENLSMENLSKRKPENNEQVKNDTNETSKGEPESSTTENHSPIITTRKSALLKEPLTEKSTSNLINNNIESEFVHPHKNVTTTTTSTTDASITSFTAKLKGDLSDTDKLNLTSTTVKYTTSTPNISDLENIIPLQLGTESILKKAPSSVELSTTTDKPRENYTQRIAIDIGITSTETVPTTTDHTADASDTTTIVNNILSDGTTMVVPEEGTTIFVIDNATEYFETTSDSGVRTSKSLGLVMETSTTETSTTEMSISINGRLSEVETTTIEKEIDTTTVENEKTTTEIVTSTTEKVATTQASKDTKTTEPTTTEFSIVYIESTVGKQTTLLPEVLSPHLNYSTSISPDNEDNLIRKLPAKDNVIGNFSGTNFSSTTTIGSTSVAPYNATVKTEDGTDTNPTENSFTTEGDSGEGGNGGKIAAIAISCVGAVCLIILAGLLYVMKKRQKRLNYGPRCRPVSLDDYSIDNLSVYNSVRRKGGARTSKRSFGNPAFEDPVAPTHPLNFPALAKFSTNFEDIRAEFEEIPQITARTSELPEGCDTKNRYANVIPLPETRVFLVPIDGYPNSDYINASYVTGPKNIKGYYIATQGPMENTVEDFWRMVWEQQTKVILMLTHLVENGLEKCVDYLPESEVLECSRLFGDFQITLKKREVKEKYIISSLQLKNMVSNSWREVTHFWYLGWPEKGVPSEANSIIAFLIEARSYMKTVTLDKDTINGIQNGGTHNEHNPVLVHCSPGTGRTGVAIACDIAIREFETTRLVDIPKIVYRIRRDRANAIQTKEQYMFIYKVVSLYATKLTGGALDNL